MTETNPFTLCIYGDLQEFLVTNFRECRRKRTSVKKIKEVLRLKLEMGFSSRIIGQALKIGKTTVQEYLKRAQELQITLEEVHRLSESELQEKLFIQAVPLSNRPMPNWKHIHLEHRKKNVTLQVLWEEYRDQHPDGLGYSRFCELYKEFAKTVEVSMRQVHKAGDKMFVDYGGKTVEIVDRKTGEVKQAQIFVAVLGASSYLYAEATWSQKLMDWISSHVRALEFFGGVPRAIVPDNLKSGVSKPWYYDPDINPTYAEFARHYGTVVLPARVRKPRDKAKAEAGVQLVQRWLLAKLRHQRFFDLAGLNQAIRELLKALNDRPFQKLPGSRRSLFESLERGELCPLPTTPFEVASWKQARVNIDYHVEFKTFLYSVPWKYAGQKVRIRATAKVLEVFCGETRIASHLRKYSGDRYSTKSAHMPPHHKFRKWPPEKLIRLGDKIGTSVKRVVEEILKSRPHPEQGFRAALGLLRLGRTLGDDRLEKACKIAIELGSPRYRSVRSILETGQDKRSFPNESKSRALPHHSNIRGAKYYQQKEDENASPTNH